MGTNVNLVFSGDGKLKRLWGERFLLADEQYYDIK
jgi:hypothetical protein